MMGHQLTYRGFLNAVYKTNNTIKGRIEEIIRHFSPKYELSFSLTAATYVLDYTSRKYLHVQESCRHIMGFTNEWFLNTGLEEYISRWHPDDFEIVNKMIFPQNMAFLEQIDQKDFEQYIFSYNYRFLTPEGNYVTVLQRSSFIPATGSKIPAGAVGVGFDITHFKTDLSVVHTIERVRNEDTRFVDLVFKKVYPVVDNKIAALFTKKEKEILTQIATGCSSKQIASSFKTSINTISNHRKNMLRKTGCKTSTELINFAMKHGLV